MKMFPKVFNYICETIGITVYDHNDADVMMKYKFQKQEKIIKTVISSAKVFIMNLCLYILILFSILSVYIAANLIENENRSLKNREKNK